MTIHSRARILARRCLPGKLRHFLVKSAPQLAQLHAARNTARLVAGSTALDCILAYTPNGAFVVPRSSHHRPAAQAILEGGVFEPDTLAFIEQHCGQGDIVSAGTYFGDFLPTLSRACAGAAVVWAFEPNPENYRCALSVLALNDLTNVRLHECALGEAAGSAELATVDQQGRGLGGHSTLTEAEIAAHGGKTIAVQIRALDEIIPGDRHVSLIQLDVERYEQRVLTGALKTIARCKPILILETVPPDPWFQESILSMGYRRHSKVHVNTIFVPSSFAD